MSKIVWWLVFILLVAVHRFLSQNWTDASEIIMKDREV